MSETGWILARYEGRPPSTRSSNASCDASRPHHRSIVTFLAFGPHQRLFADCVASALEAEGLEVERANPSTEGDLLGLVLAVGPSVFLVDGAIFEASGGEDLVDRVHERGGKVLIVAGGRPREDSTSLSALRADGIVSVAADLCALVSAVRSAVNANENGLGRCRESIADGASAESPPDRDLLATLSPREQVVLDSMMKGMSAREIADAEFVAVPTIRSQIRSILGKLQVNSQLTAVALAHRASWNASIRHNHQF